jgi:hypothetical protein
MCADLAADVLLLTTNTVDVLLLLVVLPLDLLLPGELSLCLYLLTVYSTLR